MSEEESTSREEEAEKRSETRTADEIYRQVLEEVLNEKEKARLRRYGQYVNEDGKLVQV